MDTTRRILLIASLVLLPTFAQADDDIAVDKLPQAVKTALEQRFPGADLLSAERDDDDGRIEYEVELRHDGQRYEVDVREDGKITDVDRED